MDKDTLLAWDRAHVWHPFTPMRQWIESDPLVITEADGVRLRDADGRWYYDGVSSLWLNVHGHRVKEIDSAIRDQLDRVAHTTLLGLANEPSIVLAKRLADLAPAGLTKVFYGGDGACAVEAAIKMAVQCHANRGRPEKTFVLGFTGNYHGDTLGAVGVAKDESFHEAFGALLPGHPKAPYPHCFRCPVGKDRADCGIACLSEVRAVVAREAHRLAAVIAEPVEGAGGIIPAPEGWLRGVREICDEHDVLLIVDEVATGLGRTGSLFACDEDGVSPDLLCLGKGLSGGYLPLSATLTTQAVFDAFTGEVEEGKTFFHGHSFTGNPLACAAGLASLDLLVDLLPSVAAKAALVARALEPIAALPIVDDVRQRGLMVGIELAGDRTGHEVTALARRRGMIIRPIGKVVIFLPPLASTDDELNEMLAILRDAFAEAG
ncbi:MAG: adenosylmethionine--8-amino-7-oxononanoate transaminase [Planctomycetota bacterium]